MKIAICYSGQYRTWTGWKHNHQHHLPEADTFYSTWNSCRNDVLDSDKDNTYFYPDPQQTYNCYEVKEFADIHGWHLKDKPGELQRAYTGYFQHLGHWNILQELDPIYDVVIRMRYDTFLGMSKEDVLELCSVCNKTGKSIGIGNISQADDNNKIIHFMKPQSTPTRNGKHYLLDFMTIHKPEVVNNVRQLVDQQQMWPTNAGWWQMLGQHGYLNYRGGIQLRRYT